jgi:hypothetical protein
VVGSGFFKLSFCETATPSADATVSVRFEYQYNRVFTLELGGDMLMPRRFGGFYNIAGLGVNGPNSLVTISTYCDELSLASYIMYHLVGLKSQQIKDVK